MKALSIIFLLLVFSGKAQTISGIVVDEKTQQPLSDVSVFFDNSTVGTLTAVDGTFQISIPSGNKSSLIFSVFGYEYFLIEEPKPQQQLKIALKLEENEMKELIIDQSPFSRKEMLKAFRYFFLGNTPNAKKAQILNEQNLHFYYDKNTYTLHAYADQPIKVDNKNLAYELSFHLDHFEVQFRYLTLDPKAYSTNQFLGYIHYRDTNKGKNKILKNRQKVYEEGAVNFFYKLAEEHLEDGTFFLAVNGFKIDPDEYFEVNKISDGYQLTLKKKPVRKKPVINKKTLSTILNDKVLNPDLITEYTEEEVPFTVFNTETEQQSSLYFQKQRVLLDNKGNMQSTHDVFFGGYFGELKTADMLPLDYVPAENKKKPTNEEMMLKDASYLAFEKEAIAFYSSKEYLKYKQTDAQFHSLLNGVDVPENPQQFTEWLVQNLNKTKFETKEQAVALFKERQELLNKIAHQQDDLKNKETLFTEKYGDDFKRIFYPKIIPGLFGSN
ncbi:MAG TPA: carboxypeptidase-like regulatory domain-containing protein [Flavobacterium sp.]|nr:carboxypeptidase-like regulatory domain-containing protein [Flavobacterium sp.]